MEAARGSQDGAAAASSNNNKENCCIGGGGGGGGGGPHRFLGEGEIDGDDNIASDKNQGDAGAVSYDGAPPCQGFDAATAYTVSDEYRELLERMLKQYPLEYFREYSYRKRKRTVVDDDLGAIDGGGTSNETPADSSASASTAKTAAMAASANKNMRDDLEVDDDTASSTNQGGVVYDGDPRQQGAASATSNDHNNNECHSVRWGDCGSRRVHPSSAAYPLGLEADDEGHGGEAGRPEDDSAVTSKPKSKRMREDSEEGAQNDAENSRPRHGNDVPASTEEEEEKEMDTKAKLLALKKEFDAYVAHAELEKDLAAAKSAKEVKDLSDRIAVLERAHNDSKK